MTADYYERALRRMHRISIAIGAAGVVVVLIVSGPLAAGGFLIGATLSLVNLHWWTSVAGALGSTGKPPLRASTAILLLRYLLVGGAIYVIVKILKISPVALLAGLLVTVAAVIFEVLYELTYGRT